MCHVVWGDVPFLGGVMVFRCTMCCVVTVFRCAMWCVVVVFRCTMWCGGVYV